MLPLARLLPALLLLLSSMARAGDSAPTDPSMTGPDGLPIAGYAKGFFIHSADRTRTIHATAMGQMLYSGRADDNALGARSLSMRVVRLKLRGLLASRDLRYGFLANFSDSTRLLDFYLDWGALPGLLHVRAGRYKRPFSRQFMTSVGRLEFVDRSLTDATFNIGRDVGVAVHNDFFLAKRFAWVAGLFNGTRTRSEAGDLDHFEPLVVARVEYRHGPVAGYQEADFDGGDLRFAIALGGQTELDGDDDDDARTSAAIDYVARLHHVSLSGAVYAEWQQNGPEPFDFDIDDDRVTGVHHQLSWVYADVIQPAVRWAVIARPGFNDDRQELTGSLSLYFQGHALKWQTDVTALSTQQAGNDDVAVRVRSQLQLAF